MRLLILILFALLATSAFAQSDSTEIKLQEYKQLYEKGLINEQEYGELKKKALQLESAPQQGTVVVYPKQDTVDLRQLERTYKAQLVTGSLELATGVMLVGLFVHFRNKPLERGANGYYVSSIRQARICLAASAVFSGIGIYSLVKGSKNRKKYIDLTASPGSVSLTWNF